LLGHLQAKKSAERLRAMISPESKVHLVSSPFLRCLETASPIADLFNVPIHIEESLCEWLGASVIDEDPLDSLSHLVKSHEEMSRITKGAAWVVNSHSFRPEYPEDIDSGVVRMKRALDLYTLKTTEDVLIIVTHLFTLEALASEYLGRDIELVYPGYCKLSQLELIGEDYRLVLDSDYSHAPQSP
jgi:transcription factor C subunit 7